MSQIIFNAKAFIAAKKGVRIFDFKTMEVKFIHNNQINMCLTSKNIRDEVAKKKGYKDWRAMCIHYAKLQRLIPTPTIDEVIEKTRVSISANPL